MTPAPRFSVVVPALDEEASIAACLRSMFAQEVDGGVEVIVADNASTAATAFTTVDRLLGVPAHHAR